ncbi:myelin and lymphocyte protein-like [Sinocyclocheilus anshuiensis]|uniref:myelin and lymphocyte protein-like n=1 Tax=Sinocyclocheilus anshuiensis TaxID=1608454 RepID=UPI0007BAAAFD|nr:PREDICTED: myelin and lymphocyte protein-like [Sinocyclocheilus anshuiensis]
MCVFIRHQIYQPLRQSTTDTMASSVSMMPSGSKIFTTMPDILFIPEFVCGGLVWTLVASTKVEPANPQGWVMFVSLFCFLITTLWFLIFITGINQSSIWPSLDVGYLAFSAFFYLSAAVLLANVTIINQVDKVYQLDIAAVVMAFIVTLLYWIHAILSAHRWKSS